MYNAAQLASDTMRVALDCTSTISATACVTMSELRLEITLSSMSALIASTTQCLTTVSMHCCYALCTAAE